MSTQTHAAIGEYYTTTWRQYQRVWSEKSSYALHYGYWSGDVKNHGESLLAANRRLVEKAGIGPDTRVLDAGCGVGGMAMWLARTYGAQVEGITITDSQIDVAAGLVEAAGLVDKVHVGYGDFCDAPFDDNTFDVVVAQESMCHAEDKGAFLTEMFRVLKPGGQLLVADGFRTRRPLPAKGERVLHRWVSSWLVPDLITPTEMVNLGEEAGFTGVQCVEITDEVMPSAKRMHRLAIAKIGLKRPWQLLSRREPESLSQRNVIGAWVQYGALKKGYWTYAMASATKPETA